MDATPKERQAARAKRLRAAGLTHVGAWVPASRKADLLAFAKGLREAATQAEPTLPPPGCPDGSAKDTEASNNELETWSLERGSDLRDRVEDAIANHITIVSGLALVANISSRMLRVWLKGKPIKYIYLGRIEAALNSIVALRERAAQSASAEKTLHGTTGI